MRVQQELTARLVKTIFYIFNLADDDNKMRVKKAFKMNLLPKLVSFLHPISSNEHVVECQAFAMNCIHSLAWYHSEAVMETEAVSLMLRLCLASKNSYLLFYGAKMLKTLSMSPSATRIVPETTKKFDNGPFLQQLTSFWLSGLHVESPERTTIVQFTCQSIKHICEAEYTKGEAVIIDLLFIILQKDETTGVLNVVLSLLDRSKADKLPKPIPHCVAQVIRAVFQTMPQEQIPTVLMSFPQILPLLIKFLVPLKSTGIAEPKSQDACFVLKLVAEHETHKNRITQAISVLEPSSKVQGVLVMLRDYRDFADDVELKESANTLLNAIESDLLVYL